MPQKKPAVTIRGTKDGLVFILDDACSFQDIVTELQEKLSANENRIASGRKMGVKLKTGNRYLSDSQKQQIREMILNKKNLLVESFDANVVTKAEAKEIAEQEKMTTFQQIIRSGQHVNVNGDLLIVGDVNSAAKVQATGDIFVLGALKGSAWAGSNGNNKAIIAASVLVPTHLRIAGLIIPGSEIEHTEGQAKCAYINHSSETVVVDRIQSLYQVRRTLQTS
ncbi:MAG TPA: septum site-determining protein MinC [Bacillales bacterium]|nr:septum site-determining protein MinC [Bacillales bacterium]